MNETYAGHAIELRQRWELHHQIDSGGFAIVYSAESDDGDVAVVKLIPKHPGAQRELLFVELNGVPNVVPVLDRGEWNGFWVLVMPRAEQSLRTHLVQMNDRLPAADIVPILVQITQALEAIEKKGVVHRDIKPENILFLNCSWCLSDFGISRYAEATTAPDTAKHSMTKAYAAPEQWRGERATIATDVYALGVLAYELLAGRRPFLGPDYRAQHLEDTAENIPGIPPWLHSLVDECLYKSIEARPAPSRLLNRLRTNVQSPTPAGTRLQEANAAAVQRKAEEQRLQSAAQVEAQRLHELQAASVQSLHRVVINLNQQIIQDAPAVDKSQDSYTHRWSLNHATLRVGQVTTERAADTGLPFKVVAYTSIGIDIPQDSIGYCGRSHSLWFCDASNPGEYRWYETAFMATVGSGGSVVPFQLKPSDRDAHLALRIGTHPVQVAWPFTPIDQDDEQSFLSRWMEWFAAGAQCQLGRPNPLPEVSATGSWRR